MSLPKIFLLVSLCIFSAIGCLAFCKKKSQTEPVIQKITLREDVDLSLLTGPVAFHEEKREKAPIDVVAEAPLESKPVVIEHDPEEEGNVDALFMKGSSCPIVETIAYSSRVSWKKRAAWLVDYSQRYKTPLDFIYRSLNGGRGYTPVAVSEGMQFTVLRKDLDFRFHLVVALSSCRLRLYYVIPGERRVVFLKSYPVCLGKKDASRASGSLTPVGVYSLGDRVAIFRPNMMGMHKGKKVELMQVFGSYWMPFEKGITGCSEPAKGYGIHGTPFSREDGDLQENNTSIGHFESDGCIRLCGKDIQELFSIISSHKTFVEIVPSFEGSALLQGEIVEE
jgi:hypothetical protein